MAETTGAELKRKLGLGDYPFTPFIQFLNLPQKIFLVFYDSLRPNFPITLYDIKKQKVLATKRLTSMKDVVYTPSLPLELYNGVLENIVIQCIDLAGRYGDKKKQVESLKAKEVKLNEWMTFKNLNTPDAISAFTKKHRDIRNKAVKPENFTAKLTDCQYNKERDYVDFVFTTTATTPIYPKNYEYKKTDPTHNFVLDPNPDKKYNVQFRILDFMKWLKGTRPDNLSDTRITWKEIKDVLEVAFVQVYCQCGAFHWQGVNYWLSQLDGSIYPTDIEPKFWNRADLHGDGNAFLCKHSYGIIRSIDFFANQMTAMLNKKLKNEGII